MIYLFNDIHLKKPKTQPWYALKTLKNLGYLEQSDISTEHKTSYYLITLTLSI